MYAYFIQSGGGMEPKCLRTEVNWAHRSQGSILHAFR